MTIPLLGFENSKAVTFHNLEIRVKGLNRSMHVWHWVGLLAQHLQTLDIPISAGVGVNLNIFDISG
jgi:hypothetical protein